MKIAIMVVIIFAALFAIVGVTCLVVKETRIGILSLSMTVVCVVATVMSATSIHNEREQLRNDFANNKVSSVQRLDNDEFIVVSGSGMYFLTERQLIKVMETGE